MNADDYNQDQNYDPQFQTHDQYEHGNGMNQYGSDDQYVAQGQYYQDDEYAIHENYDQQYYHSQPGYDHSNFQQDQLYQQADECESLESYDATQQFRFND